MKLNRREFLLLTVGLVAGCQSPTDSGGSATRTGQVINAGPASDYAADGVYTRFKDLGFFLVRKDGQLTALSAICTHRRCKLNAEADHSFYCKCHGSTFDPNGHVTQGPARRDLPVLPTTVNERGEVVVTVTEM